MRLPEVALWTIYAPEFKTLGHHDPTMHAQVIDWLTQLHHHPNTPPQARRQHGLVQVHAVETTNRWPHWRCLVGIVDPATGRPLPSEDDPTMIQSMYFHPAIPPPESFIEAMDALSGGKLTNRVDGGPKPKKPAT